MSLCRAVPRRSNIRPAPVSVQHGWTCGHIHGQMAARRDRKSEPLPRETGEESFRRLYLEHSRDLLAYALRRTGRAEDAADVVADTFAVAWRRAGEMPQGDEARLWLYGVARFTLAHHHRGERRRAEAHQRMRAELAAQLSYERPEAVSGQLMAALARLSEPDREILLLSGWEELSPSQIARVLELSAVAVRSRLHRARRRLRFELAQEDVSVSGVSQEKIELGEAR
jgi:RNA polymerase sigma factor (sigma-70 family)